MLASRTLRSKNHRPPTSTTSSLSVVIVTYNYGTTLQVAIESVAWAEEVLVVDSYSSDNTADICKKYRNVKIIQETRNVPSLKTQVGIEAAQGPWVFCLAADEAITPALRSEIQALLCDGTNEYDGYFSVDPNEGEHAAGHLRGRWGQLQARRLHYSNPSVAYMCRKAAAFAQMDAEKGTVRRDVSTNPWRIIWETGKTFVRVYAKQRYYRIGQHGVILAGVMAFRTFIELAALWERRYKHLSGPDTRGFE